MTDSGKDCDIPCPVPKVRLIFYLRDDSATGIII